MFNHVIATVMGRKIATCTNLFVRFLEETVLFPAEPSKYFYHGGSKLIDELFKSNMVESYLPGHSTLDLNVLKNILNNLHPAELDNIGKTMIINFLGIPILLHENGYAKTYILDRKKQS